MVPTVPSVEVPPRTRILGSPVDVVGMEGAIQRIVELVDRGPGNPGVVVTINPEILMRAQREPDFASLLEGAALITPDGIGIVRALRRRGFVCQRVTGVELLDGYLARAAGLGHRVALVGSGPGVAAAAAAVYRQRHPGVDLVVEAGGPTEDTVDRVTALRPQVVCAAYGPGLQERFLAAHLAHIGASVGIGIGGTLDFVSGRIRRAPTLVRTAGMEWAWRLAREPRRLRRQAVLPIFYWQERQEARRGRRRHLH